MTAYAPHLERDEQGAQAVLPLYGLSATVTPPKTPQTNAGGAGACRRPSCGRPVPAQRIRRGKPRVYCSGACARLHWFETHPRVCRQAALPGESRVERAFREWIETEDGEIVEAEIVRRARALRAAGRRHYGIAGIWEAVRYDQTIALQGEAGAWRLNNSFRSLLARRVMARVPELEGFFETRDLRGVA